MILYDNYMTSSYDSQSMCLSKVCVLLVFAPARINALNKLGHCTVMWGRLRWTDANQLSRETKVMDRCDVLNRRRQEERKGIILSL